jgi:hypothetical protein
MFCQFNLNKTECIFFIFLGATLALTRIGSGYRLYAFAALRHTGSIPSARAYARSAHGACFARF